MLLKGCFRKLGGPVSSSVVEEGRRVGNEIGVPQGGVISPLLANIYLHYVLDLWITRKVRKELAGRISLIRYGDDFVIGFIERGDAQKVWEILPDRLKQFGLELSLEKSRLIEFGKRAYLERKEKGGRLDTFDFLGFTHYMVPNHRGGVKLGRKTIGKRYRRTLVALNDKLRSLRNRLPFRKLHRYLGQVLKGYYNYYGFAGNMATLSKFAYTVERMWYKWINRRSQRRNFNWEEFQELLKRFPLPRPRMVKSYRWIYAADL